MVKINGHEITGSPWEQVRRQRYHNTDIERKLAAILDSVHPTYKRQFILTGIEASLIGHKFDFAIPSLRLVIEADGCHWHGCQSCNPLATPRARDALINRAVEKAGWLIVRYWGHAINGTPTEVRSHLEAVISGILRNSPENA